MTMALDEELEALENWLLKNGYSNLYEWGLDSDYTYYDGVWYDWRGEPTNLIECAYYAMEADDAE